MRHAQRTVSILLSCVLALATSVAMAEAAKAEVRNAPGYVHIKNVDSETCIDAQYAGPGTGIVMWRCLNTEFEEWRLLSTPIPGNRYEHCACTTVTMFVNHAMSMCMAVESDSSASGTKVVQQYCDASDEKQWWTIDPNGSIISFISKKALDVDLGRSNNGVPLQIWTHYFLNYNQRWILG